MMRLLTLCGLAAVTMTLGCETSLSALSGAPPGMVAELNEKDETIELSQGAALAFECNYQGGPCDGASITVDNSKVAEVREAFFDDLQYDADLRSPGSQTVFVLIAKQPGETGLAVRGGGADADYDVTVLAE